MQILYFASLKEFLGRDKDTVTVPEEVKTVADLRTWLSESYPDLAEAFATMPRLRCAVNQDMADNSAAVSDGDEVAFFPPVTGG